MKIISYMSSPLSSENPLKIQNDNNGNKSLIISDKEFQNRERKFNNSPIHMLYFKKQHTIKPSAQKLNTLPVYQQRFTNFNSDQTEHGFHIVGYASAEEFFASQPYDEKASQTYSHRNPKQEVVELIQLKQKEILQKIETIYQEFKHKIDCSKNKQELKKLLNESSNEMSYFLQGPKSLKSEGNMLIHLFDRALDQIKYNKENRWIAAGTWSEWSQQDWNGYWKKILLPPAKEQVRTSGQQAIQKLNKEIKDQIHIALNNLKTRSEN